MRRAEEDGLPWRMPIGKPAPSPSPGQRAAVQGRHDGRPGLGTREQGSRSGNPPHTSLLAASAEFGEPERAHRPEYPRRTHLAGQHLLGRPRQHLS